MRPNCLQKTVINEAESSVPVLLNFLQLSSWLNQFSSVMSFGNDVIFCVLQDPVARKSLRNSNIWAPQSPLRCQSESVFCACSFPPDIINDVFQNNEPLTGVSNSSLHWPQTRLSMTQCEMTCPRNADSRLNLLLQTMQSWQGGECLSNLWIFRFTSWLNSDEQRSHLRKKY